MTLFKVCSYLVLYVTLTACSSTITKAPSSNEVHYYTNSFTHTEFSTHNKSSMKKQASSDRQLMLSLVNRPIPEDQRMMLTFAKNQASYYPDSSLVGIQIKGDKGEEGALKRVSSIYANMIEQDSNAVSISAMPQ